MADAVHELVEFHLKQPYARIITPEDDGTYRGEILELSGCIATGDTPNEAFAALEDAARAWLDAAVSLGQTIPNPVDVNEFSGRLVLRLSKSLHKKAARLAEREGVSLNQFIAVSVAESVGERAKPSNAVFVNAVSSMRSGVYQTLQGVVGLAENMTAQTIGGLVMQISPVTLMPATAANPLLRTG